MVEYIEREVAYSDFEKCNAENQVWTPSRVKTLIARQPSADVAPVQHGRWKLFRAGDWTSVYECSVCRRRVSVSCDRGKAAERLMKLYPYCNCGARMDKEAGNETEP